MKDERGHIHLRMDLLKTGEKVPLRVHRTEEENKAKAEALNQFKKAKAEDGRFFLEKMKDAPQLDFTVEIDGKVIDYSKPVTGLPKTAHLFGDLDFLRRSNEIKELLKKKHKEVFGIKIMDTEYRYCDVGHYDPKFELIQLEPKVYNNTCDKAAYCARHQSEECTAQAMISNINSGLYDLGYECYDDYLDYRYQFSPDYKLKASMLTSKDRVCGIDGCQYHTCYDEEMEEHQKRHNEDLPFCCPEPNCMHKCKTRVEYKYHLISHAKLLYTCPVKGCRMVKTYKVNDAHIVNHLRKEEYKLSKIRNRFVCPLCRRMERNYFAHRKLHKELFYHCPIPGCKHASISMNTYKHHRIQHYIMFKKQKKCPICFQTTCLLGWPLSLCSASRSSLPASTHEDRGERITATLSIFADSSLMCFSMSSFVVLWS